MSDVVAWSVVENVIRALVDLQPIHDMMLEHRCCDSPAKAVSAKEL